MFNVTALYLGTEEIACSEGDGYEWTMADCAEQCSELFMYPAEDVTLVCTQSVHGCPVEIRTPLTLWLEFA